MDYKVNIKLDKWGDVPRYSVDQLLSYFTDHKVLGSMDVGEYQGDTLTIHTKGDSIYLSVAGYGSCSVCDELEYISTLNKEDAEKRYTEYLTDIMRGSRKFNSKKEVLEFLNDKDNNAKNNWYMMECNYNEALKYFNKVLRG